jgi:ABC-type Na+ efflux pump permease subunit
VERAVARALEHHARPVPAARIVPRYAGGNAQKLTVSGILGQAALVLSLLFGSLFVVPLGFCEERENGLVEAVLLSGISIGTVVSAKIGFGMILTLSASLAVVGISQGVAALPVALAHLLPTVACLLAIGLAVSLIARTRKQAELGSAAAMMLLAVPALSMEASPTVAMLARWTPTGATASDLALDLAGAGVPWSQRLLTWAVLAVWAGVAFAFAVRQVRRLEA